MLSRGWSLRLAIVTVALPLLSASGCAEPDGTSGDCTARIEFDGTRYRSHNRLNPSAPIASRPLGEAKVLDCTDEGWEEFDSVTVRPIKGVDPSIAIAVDRSEEWWGIYVADNTTPSEWPRVLKRGRS